MQLTVVVWCPKHGTDLISVTPPGDARAFTCTLLDGALAVWVDSGDVYIDGDLLATLAPAHRDCAAALGHLQLHPLEHVGAQAIAAHRQQFPRGRVAGQHLPRDVTTSDGIRLHAMVTAGAGPLTYRITVRSGASFYLRHASDLSAHPDLVTVLERFGEQGADLLARAGTQWPDALAAAVDALTDGPDPAASAAQP